MEVYVSQGDNAQQKAEEIALKLQEEPVHIINQGTFAVQKTISVAEIAKREFQAKHHKKLRQQNKLAPLEQPPGTHPAPQLSICLSLDEHPHHGWTLQ